MGANAIKGGEPATIGESDTIDSIFDYSLHAIVGFQFWRMLSKIEKFGNEQIWRVLSNFEEPTFFCV